MFDLSIDDVSFRFGNFAIGMDEINLFIPSNELPYLSMRVFFTVVLWTFHPYTGIFAKTTILMRSFLTGAYGRAVYKENPTEARQDETKRKYVPYIHNAKAS